MRKVSTVKDRPGEFHFWCPGCEMMHVVYTDKTTKGPCWVFNGNMEFPTFNPSIRVQWHKNGVGDQLCHSFVKDGKIQFLGDCTHSLKGQTVKIPNWDDI